MAEENAREFVDHRAEGRQDVEGRAYSSLR